MLSKTVLCVALGLARFAFALPVDASHGSVQPRGWLLIGGDGKPKGEDGDLQRRGWLLIGGDGKPKDEDEALQRRGWQIVGGGQGKPYEEADEEDLERRGWLLIGGASCGWRCAEGEDPSQPVAEGGQPPAADA
ncbi:hypothetical protein PWT90_06095 [Aphanocladium album]|nr:hypothetical protein PWT90_06095 [Aphanocladium album]